MNIKAPRTERCVLWFSITFLLQYLLEHAVYMLTDAAYSGKLMITAPMLNAVRLTVQHLIEAVELLSLAAVLTVVLLTLLEQGKLKALKSFGIIAATKLIYIVPHYYMTYLSYAYDSIEALLLVIPTALGLLLLMLGEISAAIFLAAIPSGAAAKQNGSDWRDVLSEEIAVRELTDVGNRGTAALAIAAAVITVKSFVMAIIDTVSFFIDYGTGYSSADVFSILFALVYPLALMVIAYILMQAIKIRTLEAASSIDDEEDEPKTEE